MNRLAIPLAAVALTLFDVVAASGADVMPIPAPVAMPQPAPVYDWTGLYVGAQLGWRFDSSSVTLDCERCRTGGGREDIDGATYDLDLDTLVGGVHAGYNRQLSPRWLIGVEADGNWGAGSDSIELLGFDGTLINADLNVDHTWDASFRARVGILLSPTLLLYGTGGVSFLGEEVSGRYFDMHGSGSTPFAGSRNVRVGWAAGIGAEAQVTTKVRVRAEWIHADYGGESYSDGVGLMNFDIDSVTDTLRVGVSLVLN
jgi:outer membrane immunogenic protein